jgi:ubiquinone/menaquinone biosynthesis C-methylase UbiE
MNFDEKAKAWDKDPKRVERAGVFANEILKFLGKIKLENALEFGSGTGLVSFYLKDHFNSITLADNSSGMINVLKEKIRDEKISNMKPLLIDIIKEKGGLSEYDILYTLLTLHHIKDIPGIFKLFNSILKPGGYLFIGDIVTEDGTFHQRDPEFDGHKGFDTDELQKLLVLNGFLIEFESIFCEIEREDNNKIKKFPLFLIIGKKLN